jgi:hypothetical protein
VRLAAAFPGVAKKYFAGGRTFHQVMIVLEKIVTEYPCGVPPVMGTLKPDICPMRLLVK